MASQAEHIIDQRNLRRKLSFWRIATIFIAVFAIIAAALYFAGSAKGTNKDHIAKIRIEGAITHDEELIERIEKIGETESAKALIVFVNSPGGTTTGGEAIFDAVRAVGEKKPVVANVGTLAASAGYMIATASDHIVSRETSIVGSIGVIFQLPNVTGLLDKIGVEFVEIKSSPLKAEPSPFNPTTEAERAMINRMITASYDWFVDLVADRRPLDRPEVLKLADGSVFIGRQAIGLKLVDALGGEEKALEWLAEQDVDTDLEVVEWAAPAEDTLFFRFSRVAWTFFQQAIGLSANHGSVDDLFALDRTGQGNLLAIWRPVSGGSR